MRRAVLIALGLLIAGSSASSAEIDLAQCALCHGTDGNGNAAVGAPKIAGLEPWYLKRQLESFRAGWRGMHEADERGNEMRAVAAAFADDAAVDRAVAHVASFAPKKPFATVDGDTTRGRTLYDQCATCHGQRGEGNVTLRAPALANTSDWYLLAQLRNYMDGIRGTAGPDSPGIQMRAVAMTLPDTQAAADVVAYINTLR